MSKLFYDNDVCNQFVRDMENAGFTVEHYRGRMFWEGPAVRTTRDYDEDDIVRATEVRLQRDDMGLGAIRYPHQRGKLVKTREVFGETEIDDRTEADLKEEGLQQDIYRDNNE